MLCRFMSVKPSYWIELYNVFLQSFIKDRVYIRPVPNNFPEFKYKIEESIAYMTFDFLTEVCEELNSRLEARRITKSAQIGHLKKN